MDRQSEVDFNLSLNKVKFASRYSFIVVDEAQDLSYQALRLLKELATENRIVFCQDNHQNLRHKLSSRPYLEQLFGDVKLNTAELFSTYRCPLKVIEAANEILAFKQWLSGGLGEKREMKKIGGMASREDMGHVYFLSAEDLSTCSTWNEADFAIVTSEAHLESAKARFPNALIFTPETIKGLEYPKVLAYCLFSKNFFQRAAQRIEEVGGKRQSLHRAKAGQSDNQFVSELNAVYTSWTRASSMLFIYEEADHYAEEIFWKGWRDNMEKGLPPAEVLLSKKTSREEWLAQVDLLLNTDNTDLALSVCKKQLGFIAEEFQRYVLEHDQKALVAQEKARALPLAQAAPPANEVED